MTRIALIPVKGLINGKQRLAGSLSASERSLLIQCMLDDVLQAARATRGFDEIWIVSDDERVMSNGCRRICDVAPDLNTAVGAAARQAAKIANSIVILAADLPLAAVTEVEQLIEAARFNPVVIVPDVAGTGTNALALSPPTAIEPQFGRDSRWRHEQAAHERELPAHTLLLPTLAIDIDEPTDLEQLRTTRPDRYGFLSDWRKSA